MPLITTLKIDKYCFKRVEQFKYLGTIVTEHNEIMARVQADNKCYQELAKVLSSKSLSRNLKIQLNITLINRVILYRAETWPMKKLDEKKFLKLEKKILPKIFRSVRDGY